MLKILYFGESEKKEEKNQRMMKLTIVCMNERGKENEGKGRERTSGADDR